MQKYGIQVQKFKATDNAANATALARELSKALLGPRCNAALSCVSRSLLVPLALCPSLLLSAAAVFGSLRSRQSANPPVFAAMQTCQRLCSRPRCTPAAAARAPSPQASRAASTLCPRTLLPARLIVGDVPPPSPPPPPSPRHGLNPPPLVPVLRRNRIDDVGKLSAQMLGYNLVTKQTPPAGVPVRQVCITPLRWACVLEGSTAAPPFVTMVGVGLVGSRRSW
jgi:hypothetical protein